MGAEGVKAGVLLGRTATARLPAEGCVGGDRCGALLVVEVALIRLALRCPDRPKQAGHGREATCPWEIWLGKTGRGESRGTENV